MIYTNHFTIFGSSALPSGGSGSGGSGSGGSGSGGSDSNNTPPSFTTSFDEGAQTITLNGVGISPEKFKTSHIMSEPVSVQTGMIVPVSLTLYEDLSWENIVHIEMCLNKQITNNLICDSDTKIIWDKNHDGLEIIDPNGIIGDASIDITEINRNVATFDYSLTFDGIMDTSDIQIYSWDSNRNALAFSVEDAIVVTEDKGSNRQQCTKR